MSEKPIPSLLTLRDMVTMLCHMYVSCVSQPMICEVCRKAATGTTEEIPQGRFCGVSLCDEDTGNRKMKEDFRAPYIRKINDFLKKYDTKG